MGDETAGDRLAKSLASSDDPASLSALIVEAGRMKDRLDHLDRILSGDTDEWLRLEIPASATYTLRVVIDGAAVEARQLATVFRQTLAEITRRQGGEDPGRRGDDDGAPSWM